jgi:PEP-CTERM motif
VSARFPRVMPRILTRMKCRPLASLAFQLLFGAWLGLSQGASLSPETQMGATHPAGTLSETHVPRPGRSSTEFSETHPAHPRPDTLGLDAVGFPTGWVSSESLSWPSAALADPDAFTITVQGHDFSAVPWTTVPPGDVYGGGLALVASPPGAPHFNDLLPTAGTTSTAGPSPLATSSMAAMPSGSGNFASELPRNTTNVPEPATGWLVLVALALLGFVAAAYRRLKTAL